MVDLPLSLEICPAITFWSTTFTSSPPHAGESSFESRAGGDRRRRPCQCVERASVRLPTSLLIGEETITDSSGGVFDHIFPGNGQVNAVITMAGDEEIDRAVERRSRATTVDRYDRRAAA